MSLVIPIVLLLMGSVTAVVGANSYLKEDGEALCMACGMTVVKSDPSALLITSPGQPDQWACCPVCAAEVGAYFENAVVTGKCQATGQTITLTIKDGALASVSPSTACMLAGGGCMKNKFAGDEASAATLRTRYDWAASVPLKTAAEVFAMGKAKLATATIAPKPSLVSSPVYALVGGVVVLIALAPVTWLYFSRREKQTV